VFILLEQSLHSHKPGSFVQWGRWFESLP